MNPEITQFDIIQSKLLQQLKNKTKKTNVNIWNNNFKYCLINFIMIVNI
jgi:hypothetical protein